MKYQEISLPDEYPLLNKYGNNAYLQIYLSDNLTEMHRDEQKHPVLIVCPGGGYAFCSQREGEPIAFHFLPEGYHVFVVHYSTAPAHYPAQLLEIAATLDLLEKHADEWHCDTTRVAIMGFSAGAHLAGMYTNRYACDEIRAHFPKSRGGQAAVLCYPVITAEAPYAHEESFFNLIGSTPTSKQCSILSCEKLVTQATPPTFLMHTASDDLVPVQNSLLYAEALARAKIPFELHIYPDGIHGLSTGDAQTLDVSPLTPERGAAWLPAAKKWLCQTL